MTPQDLAKLKRQYLVERTKQAIRIDCMEREERIAKAEIMDEVRKDIEKAILGIPISATRFLGGII